MKFCFGVGGLFKFGVESIGKIKSKIGVMSRIKRLGKLKRIWKGKRLEVRSGDL